MMTSTKLAVGTAATILALLVTTVLAQTRTEEGTPTVAAATPEEAVAAAVGARNAVFAGDCASAISPQDLGKTCSKFVEQSGNRRAYLIGRTFSEFTTWVFVEQTAAGWRFVATAPLDDTASTLTVPWPAT